MGFQEVKKELQKLDCKDLIKHIGELYKKYPNVKEYFDFYTTTDEAELLNKYKSKVREGFYPKRGNQLKLSLSRKAINDFRKLGTSSNSLADLLFYYVECGVEFTNDYGDIDENFYTGIENTYANALELIHKEALTEIFQKRAVGIVNNSAGTGWGFHDYLSDVYYTYYSD